MKIAKSHSAPTTVRVVGRYAAVLGAAGVRSDATAPWVSDRLGCEAMSLYYYVADKKALLAGMVAAVVSEIVGAAAAIPDADDWRDAVRARCLVARTIMLRHPWAPVLTADTEAAPPELMPLYEQLVGTLVQAGLGYDLAHRAIHALGSMVLGFSNELFDVAGGDSQLPSEDELAALAATMPHLARLAGMDVHESVGSLSECDTQAEFEFTLDLVLDGLETARRQAASAEAGP